MKDNKEQWEEGMLENNSYYDIDIINKIIKMPLVIWVSGIARLE